MEYLGKHIRFVKYLRGLLKYYIIHFEFQSILPGLHYNLKFAMLFGIRYSTSNHPGASLPPYLVYIYEKLELGIR